MSTKILASFLESKSEKIEKLCVYPVFSFFFDEHSINMKVPDNLVLRLILNIIVNISFTHVLDKVACRWNKNDIFTVISLY